MSVGFAFAQDSLTQQGAGGGGSDATSANFSMKAAVADPGVGQSQSANYIYNHGTLWIADGSTLTLPPPVEVPIGGSGGGSGSGWDDWWGIEDPDLGVSAFTPAKSAVVEEVVQVVREVSSPEMGAIPVENFKQKAASWIIEKCPNGCVLVGVNPDNGISEVAVTLVKRVLPWPFWLVIALIVVGIAGMIAFALGALTGSRVVWGAGALVLIGLGVGAWMRAHYRLAFRETNFMSIVDARVVSQEQADEAVKTITDELPLGGHTITVLGDGEAPQMTITVYVKKALPI